MAEKEYIDREALLDDLDAAMKNSGMGYVVGQTMKRYIKRVPAADVTPVVHGEWIIKTNYKTPVSHAYIRKEKLYICPYCGKDYRQHMNFCGNCGAKMVRERAEETL